MFHRDGETIDYFQTESFNHSTDIYGSPNIYDSPPNELCPTSIESSTSGEGEVIDCSTTEYYRGRCDFDVASTSSSSMDGSDWTNGQPYAMTGINPEKRTNGETVFTTQTSVEQNNSPMQEAKLIGSNDCMHRDDIVYVSRAVQAITIGSPDAVHNSFDEGISICISGSIIVSISPASNQLPGSSNKKQFYDHVNDCCQGHRYSSALLMVLSIIIMMTLSAPPYLLMTVPQSSHVWGGLNIRHDGTYCNTTDTPSIVHHLMEERQLVKHLDASRPSMNNRAFANSPNATIDKNLLSPTNYVRACVQRLLRVVATVMKRFRCLLWKRFDCYS